MLGTRSARAVRTIAHTHITLRATRDARGATDAHRVRVAHQVRHHVTVTDHGKDSNWSVEAICDDALQYADLSLVTCPRVELTAPGPDPFRRL